jgi:ribosome maturation factor RimP
VVAFKETVEQVVAGLGYDLVELGHSAAGLLRVTIDWPAQSSVGAVERFITLSDCEKVTRQLQFALEVEAVQYRRLEVTSPGIDRLLRGEQDFVRFAGQVVDVTLKLGIAAQSGGKRKKFRGTLQRSPPEEVAAPWRVVWRDEPSPGQKVGKKTGQKKALAPLQVLCFSFDQLREARLAPLVNFKGRAAKNDNAADVDEI